MDGFKIKKKITGWQKKVILDFQKSLDDIETQDWVHPLIIEYGENSRKGELELIEKYSKLIDSPCHMNDEGFII